jgi:hypothetical protein
VNWFTPNQAARVRHTKRLAILARDNDEVGQMFFFLGNLVRRAGRGIGRIVRRAAPILRSIARIAAPIVPR